MSKLHSSKNSVSLEDLLQWKKNEKPDPDFWMGFEEKVRFRSVQSMVSSQTIWDRLHQSLVSRTNIALALPSFALLVITIWSATNFAIVSKEEPTWESLEDTIIAIVPQNTFEDLLLRDTQSIPADLSLHRASKVKIIAEQKKPYQQDFALNQLSTYSKNSGLSGLASITTHRMQIPNWGNIEF